MAAPYGASGSHTPMINAAGRGRSGVHTEPAAGPALVRSATVRATPRDVDMSRRPFRRPGVAGTVRRERVHGGVSTPVPLAAAAAALKDAELSARQVEILHLLADGLTATAMARRLGCSPRTVQKHLENIYRRLVVRDRVSAVLEAQRRNLLPRA